MILLVRSFAIDLYFYFFGFVLQNAFFGRLDPMFSCSLTNRGNLALLCSLDPDAIFPENHQDATFWEKKAIRVWVFQPNQSFIYQEAIFLWKKLLFFDRGHDFYPPDFRGNHSEATNLWVCIF